MRTTRFIISLIVLIIVILVTRSSNAETTCTENELGDQTCVTTTTTTVPGVTTDNLLSNDFQDGSWNYSSNMQFHGSKVLATTHNSSADSTVSLSTDGGLTKEEINSGFTSTFGAEIWFWQGSTNWVTLKQTLTDDNGNVITQQRIIEDTTNGPGTNYTDTITVNANTQSDYSIKAEISNVSANTSLGHYGPDIENPSLVVTTNSSTATSTSETFTYCYDRVPNACTYDNEALEDIADFKTDDGKSYDEYINEVVKVEDLTEEFKVANIETSIIVEDLDGKLEEFKIEDYAVETFNNFIEANDLTETFETALIDEGLGKEEFFDTMTDSIKEEFGEDFDMGGDDFKTEGGPSDITENTVEVKEEETVNTETKDLKESNDTITETKVEEESNEEISQSKDSENVSNESNMDKNTETERTETETNNEKTVETTANTDIKTDSGSSIDTRSIEKKVERVIAKVLAKLKKVDQKLQAVQFITTQGIKSGEADISGYINKRIYSNSKSLSDIHGDEFFQKINILEQQQIYNDASLNAYTDNDPIAVKQNALFEIEQEKNRIKSELYALKQKRG